MDNIALLILGVFISFLGIVNKNPKKLQREINKELKKKTIGTKAQIALSKAYEENKIERKKKSKAYKEMEKERQFAIKQLKKKEKHKGH